MKIYLNSHAQVFFPVTLKYLLGMVQNWPTLTVDAQLHEAALLKTVQVPSLQGFGSQAFPKIKRKTKTAVHDTKWEF